jgi:esterase/lipase
MKEFLSEQMFQEMWEALQRGETYNYSDANTAMSISPNGLSIQYTYPAKQSLQDTEVQEFLDYCSKIDADVFTEACESFEPGELKAMEDALDTPDYKTTIDTFTQRVRSIANTHLSKITNDAYIAIAQQEELINQAQRTIEAIREKVDHSSKKYQI